MNQTASGLRNGLLYQIAIRLLLVAMLFTALNTLIILFMYVQDRDELAQDLVSAEAERVATQLDAPQRQRPPAPLRPPGGVEMDFTVYGADGAPILAGTSGRLPLPAAPLTSLRSLTQREDLGGSRFRLIGIRQVGRGDQPYWIVLSLTGQGLRPFLPAIFKELVDHALIPLIPLGFLLILFNTEVVRRMLSPLGKAVAAVDAIDPARIGQRLELPAGPSEVRRLLGAFNRAMDRMEGLIRTLGEFTADAAHELRTPLSIMTLSIGQLPDSETKRKLQADAAGMTRLVSQMLQMAQAEALHIAPESTANLAEVATSVIEQLIPMAVVQGRTIRLDVREQPLIAGQVDMLERALRNIVENGLAHTPVSTSVEVTVGPGANLSVRDHGPGIPPQQLPHVLKRFWRADRRRSNGSGLGLGIAARIVEAHRGTIEIGNADGGGALVRMCFPAPPAPAQTA